MPRMLGRFVPLRVLFILLTLAISVFAPVAITGALDSNRARIAFNDQDYASAAQYYQSAARKLPWRPELWEQAAIAISHVDTDAAIALFEYARERGILSANGWAMYGAQYWTTSRDESALKIWSAGLQEYPSHHEFYWLIHLAYRQLQDFPAEKTSLETWLAASKGSALDHYEMGLLLMASDAARARIELALASSMEPGFDSAVKTLRASLDLAAAATDDSRRLVVIGRGLGLVNEWPLAKQTFEQAINVDADNAQAWAWLGEARQQTGADGRAELDRAFSLDVHDTVVHGLRGLYWKRQGQYGSALTEYHQAAAIEPQNPEWQVALGEAYSLSGDLVSALGSYQEATALDPSNASYWRLLAMFCADNAVRVLDVGLPAAEKAAALAPKDPQVLDALGWSYAQVGLLYNAEQALIKATVLDPDLAIAHLHLAETDLRKGDQVSALAQLNLAMQLDGDGPVGKLALQLRNQYFP